MAFSAIPLGVRDRAAVGWALDLVFIMSLSLLPSPRRYCELMLVLAATLSTMIIFALERANPDVLLFLMALAAGVLAQRSLFLRILGYLLALLAALVKYYPIMVLVIVFREIISIFIALSVLILACVAMFWVEYHVDVTRGLPSIAQGSFNTDLFAAKNLPSLLGEAAAYAAQPSTWAPLVQRVVTSGLYAILLGSSISICRRLLCSGELREALVSLTQSERTFLIIGSGVIAGCFFAGQSIGYRGVYFLLVMPGLLAMSRRPDVRKLSFATSLVIVVLMWGECLRVALYKVSEFSVIPEMVAADVNFLFWFFRELGWWWTVSVMLTIIIDFVWDSPVVRWVSSRFGYPAPGIGCSIGQRKGF